MYSVTDEGMKWLEDHNCEWVKVEANPGDLIICKSSPIAIKLWHR